MKTFYEVTESINGPLYVEGNFISLTWRSCSCAEGKKDGRVEAVG